MRMTTSLLRRTIRPAWRSGCIDLKMMETSFVPQFVPQWDVFSLILGNQHCRWGTYVSHKFLTCASLTFCHVAQLREELQVSYLVKNGYHNGHPDLIPAGMFPNNAVQHATEGVEIKASRYLRGWQGHNPENAWLMVFVFDSNRPTDFTTDPKPFRFVMVLGARLLEEDWLFAGRSATSRRTITASVTRTGYEKMMANWIYKAATLTGAEAAELLQPPRPEPLEPQD
jgi:hypothetical protein